MEKKQTAVQWLTKLLMNGYTIDNKIITQAKQMEKEQIETAYRMGDVNGIMDNELTARQYYESKYGKDEDKAENND